MLHLRVEPGTPRHLWAGATPREAEDTKRCRTSCVPMVRPRTVTWSLSGSELKGNNNSTCDALSGVERFQFGIHFNDDIRWVKWPPNLKWVGFGTHFNRSVNRVSLPASVRSISFSYDFEKTLTKIEWPASLQDLFLFCRFKNSIKGIVWPNSLRKLVLCDDLKTRTPLGGIPWPASLQVLRIGCMRNEPIDEVPLPESLKKLTIFRGFRSIGRGCWSTWIWDSTSTSRWTGLFYPDRCGI